MRLLWFMVLFACLARTAQAHDAFGDMGEFYAHLLHPLAAPLQGLLIITAMCLLAAHAGGVIRIALPAFLGGAALAAVAVAFAHVPPPIALHLTIACLALALAALTATSLSQASVIACAVFAGLLVGASADPPTSESDVLRPLLGTIFGISLIGLYAWAAMDWLRLKARHAPSVTALGAAVLSGVLVWTANA